MLVWHAFLFPPPLAFHSRTCGAFNEVALEDEEENQHRNGVEHRACYQQIVFGIVGTLKEIEAQWERVHIPTIQDQQGPEEVIPGTLETKNCNRGQGWFYQGQDDLVKC